MSENKCAPDDWSLCLYKTDPELKERRLSTEKEREAVRGTGRP